ncbi:hypothetical protein AGOR_G00064570 [Albula goreensis]|uniref:Centromere protein Q n=1 Tax=Albula goreensis TaxID=1534307 RepID=A0A8T3DTM6_9TELE|nr:hypothetical protein AGOR_G00064570 [Albula goreensis]
MKLARASGRASTKGPKSAAQGRKKGQERPSQDSGSTSTTAHEGKRKRRGETQQDPQKRSVEKAPARKVKGQEKWKLLPKSSITFLESILDLSILSVVTMRRKDKGEFQKHLNQLKNRFLARCTELRVPPRKQGDVLLVSRLHQAETKKSSVGRKILQTVEGEVSSVVSTLEQMEVRMESLEQEIRTLRAQLDDEEERAQELLQLPERGVLNLPALPPHTAQDLPLQEWMVSKVKDPNTAARLVGAMLSSSEVRDVRAFLELAHQQTEHLLLKPPQPSPALVPEDSSAGDV